MTFNQKFDKWFPVFASMFTIFVEIFFILEGFYGAWFVLTAGLCFLIMHILTYDPTEVSKGLYEMIKERRKKRTEK